MKPLAKYRGGKSKEILRLEKHIPDFNGRYIESFFGGGALFFYLEPQKAIINDINSKLMDLYKDIKSDFDNLKNELLEIEKIYKINRKKFEELKIQTPTERVIDDNETLYYRIRAYV